MRDYELVMVISPEVTDEAVPTTVERVQQFIVEQGGEVKEVDPWGRRRLAYPIDHHKEASYVPIPHCRNFGRPSGATRKNFWL